MATNKELEAQVNELKEQIEASQAEIASLRTEVQANNAPHEAPESSQEGPGKLLITLGEAVLHLIEVARPMGHAEALANIAQKITPHLPKKSA